MLSSNFIGSSGERPKYQYELSVCLREGLGRGSRRGVRGVFRVGRAVWYIHCSVNNLCPCM